MAQQIINVGASPNDGTGDTLRDSQVKANQNFTELYGAITPFNPSDYDLSDFTNSEVDRFAKISDIPIQSINAGTNITINNTDPKNPIINATGGLTDAPSNGSTYGRKDGAWTEIAGGEQIITMHHPLWNCKTQNQWRRWQVNASSILADSDNGSIGTGTTPDSSLYYACNVLKVTNKTQLKGLTLSLRNSSSAHTIQLYVESRNFVAGSPGFETNSQVLINESFTVTEGFTKSNFTINTHTLNANSVIYFFFRRTSATVANDIYGVQLDWKFQ